MRAALADRRKFSRIRMPAGARLLRHNISGFLHRGDYLEREEMFRFRDRLQLDHHSSPRPRIALTGRGVNTICQSKSEFGAFVPGPRCVREPTGNGRLDGLTFAVKDLIDVGGSLTGGGNPDWLASHSAARRSASAV